MLRTIRFLIGLLALLASWPLQAQLDLTVFSATGRGGVATTFATDYQALGINPANIGMVRSFRDPLLTIGVGEGSVTFSAEAIPRAEMLQAIREALSGRGAGYNDQLSYAEKIQAGRRLAGTDININTGFMPIGIGLRLPRGHGLAFSLRTRFQFFANMNSQITDLMFMGVNSSYFEKLFDGRNVIDNPRNPNNPGLAELTDQQYATIVQGFMNVRGTGQTMAQLLAGSRITASLSNEYNFGYGARIFNSYYFSLYGGLDVSLVRGVMLLNIDVASDQTVRQNVIAIPDGLAITDSAQLNFDPRADWKTLAFPSGVSSGLGYTAGITAVIKKNFRVGMSLSNWRGGLSTEGALGKLGAVVLSENAYAMSETTTLEEFNGQGLDSYNFFANTENFKLAGPEGTTPFTWQRVSLPTQELPANFRFGASYDFVKTLHIGIDVIMPLNRAFGNPAGPFFAFGGDLRLSRLLRISSGANAIVRADREPGQSFFKQANIPLGITYTARKGFYEMGIATRDITTYLFRNDGSTISFATGFMRFMLGSIKDKR